MKLQKYVGLIEQEVHRILQELGYPHEIVEIEATKHPQFGDFTVKAYTIAKKFLEDVTDVELGPIVLEVARAITEKALESDWFLKVEQKGPYVNFFLNRAKFGSRIIEEIQGKSNIYGESGIAAGHTVLDEFSSPNTNKPQHIGHIRNNLIGESIAKIFEKVGARVIKMCLVNDRGIHICKSMLAYQKWGEESTPESEGMKGDHFVGKFYVMFEQDLQKERESFYERERIDPEVLKRKENAEETRKTEAQFLSESSLMKEAQRLLTKWEADDSETRELWRKMNAWVMDGFLHTYRGLGVSFDSIVMESDIYGGGKEIVQEALERGFFVQREDGMVFAPLKNFCNLPDKAVLRKDGTALYSTQDIKLAHYKFEKYPITYSIYVVASEQDLYFQQLFAILKMIGFPHADDCFHRSYGMVYLPEGKMKSREGRVVDADDLIGEMVALAYNEIIARKGTDEKGLLNIERATQIGLAALKYYILAVRPETDIRFDPEKSIQFEGKTGPYVLYAVARMNSILSKVQATVAGIPDYEKLISDDEFYLILKLSEFPRQVARAAESLDPSIIAEYLMDLAKLFTNFYRSCHVLSEEDAGLRNARLMLVLSAKNVIVEGLNLLGIESVEEM